MGNSTKEKKELLLLYSTLLIDFFLDYHYCIVANEEQQRFDKAQLIY